RNGATVYVGFDTRATILPAWLDTSWQQDTREPFASADTGFTLYKKSYPQGEVVLGGNKTPPSQGAGSMYTVVVVPQQTSLTPTPATPGDTDSDGDVDLSDLTTLLTDFGKSGTTLPGDTDGDGDVDLADLTTLLSNFGR
ncbi:hypothetical protein HY468_00795, partial [Candidatus Roizmanbacteria bacterium]|nr:hypothetical protein [Candidatus Roizmanbacteria bacterium]